MTPRLLAAISVALAFALGCGDDDDGGVSPSATASPSQTAPATESPTASGTPQPTETPPASDDPAAGPTPADTDPPNPGEVTLLQLVDKQHSLPADYVPPGLTALSGGYVAPGFSASLRSEAFDAAVRMMDDAYAAGHDIRVRSGYRSYAEQETTFAYWVSVLGYEEATRISAMAGHSEHQLGTAADLTTAEVGWELTQSFGGTAAGQWLEAHGHEYGFALSYPDGAEAITGYAYEPWHFRYIGEDAAADWKANGLTLNQYLALL